MIEILSQSTRKLDETVKRKEYQRSGVGEIWFVDRKAKRLVQHDFTDPANPIVTTYGPSDILTTKKIPGLKLMLNSVL